MNYGGRLQKIMEWRKHFFVENRPSFNKLVETTPRKPTCIQPRYQHLKSSKNFKSEYGGESFLSMDGILLMELSLGNVLERLVIKNMHDVLVGMSNGLL